MPPASNHLAVAFTFRPLANSGHSLRMVREIMILVDGYNRAGNIHQFRAARSRVPQNIVVPRKSSDGERKKSVAESARINKIVNIISRALNIGAQGIRPHGFRPSRL